jgi:AAA+ superfamily predicted ATPase
VVTLDELFGQVIEFPDPDAQERLDALVGVDHIKRRLITEAWLLLDPTALKKWSEKHHGKVTRAADEVTRRTPLLVLAGDVGCGKTEIAETFGDSVARQMRVDITLYPLSLSARGKGAVGEMTTLITNAFAEVRKAASTARDDKGRVRRGVILLIDEADALTQSRELAQMHHEDRAGVNALIRGIDQLRTDSLPVLTVLCTNRPDAIDPAISRRAASVIPFGRPGEEQRRQLLGGLLEGSTVSSAELEKLVSLTGGGNSRPYGCTYSDLRQRLIPEAVLDALAHNAPLSGPRLVELAEGFQPTRPFGDDA